MKNAWVALLGSRKFWASALAMVGVVGVLVLRAKGIIPASEVSTLVATVGGLGATLIAGIAYEGPKPPGAS